MICSLVSSGTELLYDAKVQLKWRNREDAGVKIALIKLRRGNEVDNHPIASGVSRMRKDSADTTSTSGGDG
ncbi:MAG TPA: hypothetical protein VGN53_07640 [Klebsiella sp.]|jgi:hypothetical protein